MKKIFTLLCAAVLAISASAQTLPQHKTINSPLLLKKEKSLKEFNAVRPLQNGAATNIEEICGNYNAQAQDYTQEDTPTVTFPITITPGEKENEIIITGIAEMPLGLVGTVDFENMLITIPNQTLIGKYTEGGEEYDVYFQHAAWVEDETGNQIYGETDRPLEAFILDGGILFGYQNDVFQFDLYKGRIKVRNWCAISFILAPEEYVDPFTYEPVDGMATFYDGWFLPGFGYDPEMNGRDVTLERCVENPYQFRLVNPYPESYLNVNEGTDDPGYIVFDISDPEFVIVFAGYKSGFYEKNTWGYGNFYLYNLAGLIVADYEASGLAVSTDEIKANMEKAGYTFSTLNDRTITVTDCLFGYDANPMAGGLWNIGGEAVDMTSKIVLPEGLTGIEEVVSNSNAPVEYFNLQGIRVEKPASGLYIRRQGDTAKKVYIK